MNVMRWRYHALALCAVGLVACSDRPTATELESPPRDAVSVPSLTVAQLATGDPTAIPIGSPTRIEFFGNAAASRRTLLFPLSGSAADVEQLASTARTWLDQTKNVRADRSSDPAIARVAQTVEHILAARTPEEIRAALGPTRTRIVSARSLRQTGLRLAEHTASLRLDGRELVRVVTNARTGTGAQFYCVDDPNEIAIDPTCPGADPNFDPYFNPEPIVADIAAMQAGVDAMNAAFSNLEREPGTVRGECEAERAAYVTASLAFIWAGAEAVYYAWRRDPINAYKAVKVASLAYGAALVAYQKYRACVPYDGRPRL
jgi:hypothetical protein